MRTERVANIQLVALALNTVPRAALWRNSLSVKTLMRSMQGGGAMEP